MVFRLVLLVGSIKLVVTQYVPTLKMGSQFLGKSPPHCQHWQQGIACSSLQCMFGAVLSFPSASTFYAGILCVPIQALDEEKGALALHLQNQIS